MSEAELPKTFDEYRGDDIHFDCTLAIVELNRQLVASLAREGEMRRGIDAALALSAAVTDYRHTHDFKGDGHIETGRAWDRMRNANTKFRDSLRTALA